MATLDFNDGLIPTSSFGVRSRFEVSGNRLKTLNNNSTKIDVIGFETGIADGVYSCVLNMGGLTAGAHGMIVRGSSVSNHILVAVTPTSATTAGTKMYTSTGDGTYTSLETGPSLTSFSSTGDVTIEVTLDGSSIIAVYNGTDTLSTTSTFNQSGTSIGFATDKSAIRIDDVAYNDLPVDTVTANAGPDVTGVVAAVSVALDGTGSTGTNTLTGYAWTQTAGTTVALSDATSATPTFTSPTTNANQTLTFSLTVTDGTITSTADTVNIGVLAESTQTPDDFYNLVWDGDSRTVGQGSTPATPIPNRVSLLLTPTPQFSNFAVAGQQTSAAVSSFSSNVPPEFDNTFTNNIYIINGFGINDVRLEQSSATIIANLTSLANSANTAGFDVLMTTIPPRDTTPAPEEQVRQDVNTWILSNVLASVDVVIDLNADSRIGTWSNTYYSDVSHLNNAGQDIWASIMLTALEDNWPANTAPTANAGPDQTNIVAGATIQFNFSGSAVTTGGATITSYNLTQPTGDAVTIIGGNAIANPTAVAPSTGSPQTLGFSLTVTDSNGLTSTANALNIGVLAANTLPVSTDPADQNLAAGEAFSVSFTLSDADSDAMTYTIQDVNGHGVALTDTRVGDVITVTGTAPTANTTSIIRIGLTPSDTTGAGTQVTVDLNVAASNTNTAPVIESFTPSQTVAKNTPVTLTAVGTDADGDDLAFVFRLVSGGVSLSQNNNQVSFSTLDNDNAQTIVVGVTANDGQANSIEVFSTVSVIGNNEDVTLTKAAEFTLPEEMIDRANVSYHVVQLGGTAQFASGILDTSSNKVEINMDGSDAIHGQSLMLYASDLNEINDDTAYVMAAKSKAVVGVA